MKMKSTPYKVGDTVWIAYLQRNPTALKKLTFEEALEVSLIQPMFIKEAVVSEIAVFSDDCQIRCTLKEGHRQYTIENDVQFVTIKESGFIAFLRAELLLKIKGFIDNFYQEKIDEINKQRHLLDIREREQLRRKAQEINRLDSLIEMP